MTERCSFEAATGEKLNCSKSHIELEPVLGCSEQPTALLMLLGFSLRDSHNFECGGCITSGNAAPVSACVMVLHCIYRMLLWYMQWASANDGQNLPARTTKCTKQRLMSYCSLQLDLYNEVYSGFDNLEVN